jgi:ectoine hydroxylase-related dioxygenase (phytanoyl-CoA dioxygenase family)
MQPEPLRDVTPEEIAAYGRDGFVKLAGVLSADWVDLLRETIDDMYHRRGVVRSKEMDEVAAMVAACGGQLLQDGAARPKGAFGISTDQWRQVPDLKRICLDSPVPKLAAQLFGASKINFLIDQVFLKEPGSARRTAFHSDESYFNCTGEQCATFWIAVDVVDKANGAMGYVPGSHLWRTKFKRNVFVSQQADPTSEGEQIPDIEGQEEKYGVTYLESGPGDILVHHYRTLHGSTGNVDATRIRRSAGLRYGGDDLRYFERMKIAMRSAELKNGDPMDSADFPVVWRADERVG